MTQPIALILVDHREYKTIDEASNRRELETAYEEVRSEILESKPGRHEFQLKIWQPRYGLYTMARMDIHTGDD